MNQNAQTKVLWFGDLVVNSGFGRIGNEVTTRLAMRGWQMLGVSMLWDGYPPSGLPFYVRPVAGRDIWQGAAQMIAEQQPDIVVVCQDFPYAQTMYHALRVDWSKIKFITVTPVDGTPIHPLWLQMVDNADATMVISAFGVEAMRLAGKHVDLLHPGVNRSEFYPAEDGEVAEVRGKLGLPGDAFVMGMFAMNQGRKCVSATLNVFREFAREKQDAYLFLDMDAGSPAGWDIPALMEQMGMDKSRVKFRQDAINAGIVDLRQRMLLCDVNSVVSHREGFGLPLLEGQACKVPAMALDYCSGSEICGGDPPKGVLVRRLSYMEHGTWGGARDAFPDMDDWLNKLNLLYRDKDKRAAIAHAGYEWAIRQTWDIAADQFENVLRGVVSAQRKDRANEPSTPTIPAPGLSDTRGPAAGERPDTSVQLAPGSHELPGVAAVHAEPGNNGNHSQRRSQPGVQPDAAVHAAGGTGGKKRGKPRLSGELQPVGEDGKGEAPVIP